MKKISRRSFMGFSALGATALGGITLTSGSSIDQFAANFLSGFNLDPHRFSHWSFGGIPYASPVSAQSMDFRFWFSPIAERRSYSFREEVFSACENLDRKRGGAPIALCFSGGVDSEVIAIALKQLGIPFELYFLDFCGHNRVTYEQWARPVANKLGKNIRVVEAKRWDLLGDAKKELLKFGVEAPTYLGIAQLFKNIPKEEFIVTGDGDLDRQGPLFSHIADSNRYRSKTGISVPFSTTSVFYDLWARDSGRKGEFYFFRSTPGLIASAIQNPNVEINYPYFKTKRMLHLAFPEVKKRPKTTNWEGNYGEKANRRLRLSLERLAETEKRLKFWQRLSGTIVRVDDIFKV